MLDEKQLEELHDSLQSSFQEINKILKSLGTPNRLKILIILLKEAKTFQELETEIGIKRTAMANHLKKLLDSLLIEKIHRGFYQLTRRGFYYLNGIHEAYQQSLESDIEERGARQRKEMMSTFIQKKNE